MGSSEYNYVRNDDGECVLLPDMSPREPDADAQCRAGENWYDLTAYRKIPYSTCEGGKRIDRGTAHTCPGVSGHSALFWLMMLFIPISFAGLMGYYYHKKGGYGRGCVRLLPCVSTYADCLSGLCRAIRLPGGDGGLRYTGNSSVLETLASVPWFLIGLAGIAYEWVAERVDSVAVRLQGRRGYRNVPVDEDAQILRFEDEEL